jgi:hypothetical protein
MLPALQGGGVRLGTAWPKQRAEGACDALGARLSSLRPRARGQAGWAAAAKCEPRAALGRRARDSCSIRFERPRLRPMAWGPPLAGAQYGDRATRPPVDATLRLIGGLPGPTRRGREPTRGALLGRRARDLARAHRSEATSSAATTRAGGTSRPRPPRTTPGCRRALLARRVRSRPRILDWARTSCGPRGCTPMRRTAGPGPRRLCAPTARPGRPVRRLGCSRHPDEIPPADDAARGGLLPPAPPIPEALAAARRISATELTACSSRQLDQWHHPAQRVVVSALSGWVRASCVSSWPGPPPCTSGRARR